MQGVQQLMLGHQPGYTRSAYDKEAAGSTNIPPTVEGTSKFIFSNYQYVFSCLAFCQTFGLFRTPVYRNPQVKLARLAGAWRDKRGITIGTDRGQSKIDREQKRPLFVC
jgi:hypothetical protein